MPPLMRWLLALQVVSTALPSAQGRLVFDAHLKLDLVSKPDTRSDPGFLLSFFEVGPKTKPFEGSGLRFVVAKAPNGSALTSTDGGVRWSLQQPDVNIGLGATLRGQ